MNEIAQMEHLECCGIGICMLITLLDEDGINIRCLIHLYSATKRQASQSDAGMEKKRDVGARKVLIMTCELKYS